MTKKKDSKELWLELHSSLPQCEISLGKATSQGYISDPKRISFVASRYKFCAKMLAGMESVIEIGCCDAFGSPIVADEVGKLICTDIDDETLQNNRKLCEVFNNISFEYFDFRINKYPVQADGVFLIDVIEHIFKEEEEAFMQNIAMSLTKHGVAIIGTPNITAEQYASKYSEEGHVNLKSYTALKEICGEYFNNVFMFGMNDEVLHTGYGPMSHYLWALCNSPILR